MDKPDTVLLLSDARGIYIPCDFARAFIDRAKSVANVTAEQWAILDAGPEHPEYWETWDEVLNYAVVTDANGVKYLLFQDGNLWLVPRGMEWDDSIEGFKWPKERRRKT